MSSDQLTWTSLVGSEDSVSPSNRQDLKPSDSPKSIPTRAPSSKSNGRTSSITETCEQSQPNLLPDESMSSQAAFLASRFPSPGSAEAKTMTAISGRQCFALSTLSGPLGSAVKTCLESLGWFSPIFCLIWKRRVISARHSLFQLARLELHTSGTESGYWPTVKATDYNPEGMAAAQNHNTPNLSTAVKLWATPQARDANGGKTPEQVAKMRERTGAGVSNLNEQVKVWPTPCSKKASGTTRDDFSKSLPEMVKLYPTPAAQDAKNSTLPVSLRDRDTIPGALLREGVTGQLTPEFCEWLMGYPIGFSELNASETLSFRKSLKSLRKPSTPNSQNETRQTPT